MERDFTLAENKQEEAKRKEKFYEYAFAQTGNSQMDEEVMQHVFNSMIERERRGGAETEIEIPGSYVMSTVHQLLIDRLRGKSMAERLQEQESKVETADGAQPEIESMLEKILAVGGKQIVERIQEQESKIAAADCAQPEIGRLIDAHYVPLLLSALALSDEEFDAEYPGESHVSSAQRQALAEAIREHSQDCPRCSIKFSSDIEWDEHVNGVFSKAKRHPRIYV
jgi:DNA-directed RNA polymerase specialized sigma24 family protein